MTDLAPINKNIQLGNPKFITSTHQNSLLQIVNIEAFLVTDTHIFCGIGFNGILCIYDVHTLELVNTIRQTQLGRIEDIVKHNNHIIIGSENGIYVYNIDTLFTNTQTPYKLTGRHEGLGKNILEINTILGNTKLITYISVNIAIWNINSPNPGDWFIRHTIYDVKPFESATINSNMMVTTQFSTNKLQVWDISTGTLIKTLETTECTDWGGTCSIFAKDNLIFAAGCYGVIETWDINTWQRVKTFEGPRNYIFSIAIYNNVVFSGSHDYSIYMWDFTTGEKIKHLLVNEGVSKIVIKDNKLYYSAHNQIGIIPICAYPAELPQFALIIKQYNMPEHLENEIYNYFKDRNTLECDSDCSCKNDLPNDNEPIPLEPP